MPSEQPREGTRVETAESAANIARIRRRESSLAEPAQPQPREGNQAYTFTCDNCGHSMHKRPISGPEATGSVAAPESGEGLRLTEDAGRGPDRPASPTEQGEARVDPVFSIRGAKIRWNSDGYSPAHFGGTVFAQEARQYEAALARVEAQRDELAERSTALIQGLAKQFPQVRVLCEQMGFSTRDQGGTTDEG